MRNSWHQPLLLLAILAVFAVFVVPQAQAIPAFARKYQTSCTTCHDDFPHLNDFGKAFKDAGFKFPQDDESFIKVPPTMLGAPAQKQLWPHTVWPGVIDGLPPIGLRMNNFFHVVGRNRGRFQNLPTATTLPGDGTPSVPGFIPRSDFEAGLFSIFTAGNFGSDIAFWVDDDISVAGENGGGGLGDGYLKFVNLSRFLHLPKDSLHLRAGQFELELPFSQARSWNISPWDIYGQNNAGAEGLHNVANNFTISDAARGVEISGGHHYGGYFYSLALVNQVTGTQPVDAGTLGVPSATGGAANGGLGFVSDANFKDLYARFAYRFNLERDAESRRAVQAAGPMGPRNHTFLTLGTLYFYGRAIERFVGANAAGTTVALTAREPFYRVGGDFEFNYRSFDLFGVFLYGRDHNLLPVDATGALIPLPIENTSAAPLPVGFVHGVPSTFSGGFIQADYMPVPWIMLIMRYDGVNSLADFTNGLATITSVASSPTIPGAGVPFIGPVRHTRNRFTPGVQFLIHANIKASFEYQIRPRQQIAAGVNPLVIDPVTLTPVPVVVAPFRTNTATVGLEFVY